MKPNKKVRDWTKHGLFNDAAMAYHTGDMNLWEVADTIEFIVKQELAAKVEAMPAVTDRVQPTEYEDGYDDGRTDTIKDVLTLINQIGEEE